MTSRVINKNDPGNTTGYALDIPASSGEDWSFDKAMHVVHESPEFQRLMDEWMASLTDEYCDLMWGELKDDFAVLAAMDAHFEAYLERSQDPDAPKVLVEKSRLKKK